MIDERNNWLTNRPYETIVNVDIVPAIRQNSRLLIKDTDHSTDFDPIIGYAQEPILPLIDACVPLVDIVHDIIVYAKVALDSTPDEPADGLIRDESAAIHLYTMEWDNSHESLYTSLNHTLRTNDRELLRPWYKYLKLFLTALVKIPCNPPQTVWRGVKKDTSANFPKGAQIIWWACSSTTTSLNVLESDLYLGTTGERTLFSIEVINGRNICAHSHFQNEEEILLLPGTYMEVQSQLEPAAGLHIIHLKQIVPDEILLEPPFEGARVYPKPRRSWYARKRFLIPLSTLTIVCIIGAILGSVLGYELGDKKRDSYVNWNGNNWAYACDFHDSSFLNVTTIPDACGGTCVANAGCTHFTWVETNGGVCFLKAGNVNKDDAYVTSDPTQVCGVVYGSQNSTGNSTIAWNGNSWATNCDFIGGDLLNIAVSPQVCAENCTEMNGCTHYAWSRLNGSTCSLKTGNVSTADATYNNDPTSVCGIINGSQYDGPNSTVSWNEQNWAFYCDFIDKDFANTTVKSDLCGPTCTQTPRCTHFTWTSLNGGTCWMKYGNVSKSDAFYVNDPTMVCGVV